MLLILEGPDNAGKSTIAKLLVDNYQLAFDKFIRHHTPTTMHIEVLRALLAPEERGWTAGVTLLDRWYYPSDITNEPVYTGNRSVLERDREIIERALIDLDTTFIYVTAPESVIRERYNIRGDEFVGIDQILQTHRAYERFMRSTAVPVYRVDTGAVTAEAAARIIASRFQLKERGR